MTGPLLLGVRHHGPGSARAVRAALEQYTPAAVLIEGPPEADELVPLAAQEGMRPPVALLAHAQDDPGRAAFWPLAEFSPEWVAMRWALHHGVPVRFIDLPAAHSLAMTEDEERTAGERPGDEAPGEAACGPARTGGTPAEVRVDPIRVLAATAGYDDPERWWEDVVEHRGGGGPPARRAEPGARKSPTRLRRSRRSPRRWARCGRPTATAAMTVTRCARPICGSDCGPRARSSGTASPWCAEPGTSRP